MASISKTDQVVKKIKQVKKKLHAKKFHLLKRRKELKNLCKNRGVVYINHIPHGFYEEELFKYFSQFGAVTAIKVPRSNKSGNSKGCAFVEFRDKEVAQVAADAMNNYLMFDCLLQTKYIAPNEQKPIKFDREGKPWKNRNPKEAANKRRKKDIMLKHKAVSDVKEFAKKARKRIAEIHKKMSARTGIDYQFQIDDPAEILKVTNKTIDKKPRAPDSEEDTDNEIKVKKPLTAAKKILKSGRKKLKKATKVKN